MALPAVQQMIPQVKADTSIVQETDKDFKTGVLGNAIEVNGIGHDAALKLLRNVNWRQASPSTNPGALYFVATAYDPDNGLMVLYNSVGQTWIYNASNLTWTNANSKGTPIGRYGPSMVYDQKDKVFVLYATYYVSFNPFSDTWAYNITNNTWFKRTSSCPNLAAASNFPPGMAYDPVTSNIVLYGGYTTASAISAQTWIYNYANNLWTNPSLPNPNPGARYGVGYIYNPINKTIMLFGGWGSGTFYNDTWYYNDSSNIWTKLVIQNTPPGTWSPAMVWDPSKNVAFVYGGEISATYVNTTWTFNPVTNTWTKLAPAKNPGAGYGFSMVYDAKENIILVFGGDLSGTGSTSATWYFGDLYYDSGDYISGTIDSAPGQTTVNWISISMSVKLNEGNITYQVAANDDNTSWYFLGWDGTVQTRYSQLSGQDLWSGLDGHRYLRYRLSIKSLNPLKTPEIGNVSVLFNRIPFAPVLSAPTHLKYITTDSPNFTMASQDLDQQDKLAYVLELSQDNFNTVLKTYDMTQSSTGWSKSSYAPGEMATFTIPASDKLVNGKTYQWRVRAFDGRDWSPVSVVWWFSVDTTPPEAPYSVSDGLGNDIDFTNSMDTLSAHWDSSGDAESGIIAYWYSIGTTPGGHDVLNFTDNGIRTAVTVHGLKLTSGTKYYFSVKAQNGAGLFSNVVSSNGQTVDTSAPTVPIVKDSGDYTNSKTELSAQWFSTDPESGVAQNMYAIGTSAGTTDVVNWTSIGGANQITHSGLKLVEGTAYYFSVKTQNSVGNWSQVGSSDGITVDFTPPNGVTLNISGTNGYTSSDKVLLTIGAKDKVSGVGEMEFSNDGSIWSSWVPFAKTQDWTLSSGDGLKTVYLKVKDKAENQGEVVKATIVYDTMPPTDVSLVINDNATMTKDLQVTLKVSAKDVTSGVSMMSFSNDGVGWTAWEPFASTKAWTLKGDTSMKTVWVRVQDKAGNIAPAAQDSITYGETPMVLSIANPVRTSTVSGTIQVSGSAHSDTPVTQVQVRIDGGVWKDASGAENWTIDWNTKDYPDGIHTIEVQAKDTFGFSVSSPTEVRVKNAPSKVGLSTGDVVNYLILAILVVLVVVFILFYVLARRIRKPPVTEHTVEEHEEYEAPEHPKAPPRQTASTRPVDKPPRKEPEPVAPTTVPEEIPEVAMDAPVDKPGPPVEEKKPDPVQQQVQTETPAKDEGDHKDDGSLQYLLDKLDK